MPTKCYKSIPLEKLVEVHVDKEEFVIIGSGPSLDYCKDDLLVLKKKNSVFLVADSTANFITQQINPNNRIIFSVENRRHNYLKQITGENIAFYRDANQRNLNRKNFLSLFKIEGENSSEPISELLSPGTVTGFCLTFALKCISQRLKKNAISKVSFWGIDFSYLDKRIFSRFVTDDVYLKQNRFVTREGSELLTCFKKTSMFYNMNGVLVPTSHELSLSRENFSKLISSVPHLVQFCDFSPVGLFATNVIKKVPSLLRAGTNS